MSPVKKKSKLLIEKDFKRFINLVKIQINSKALDVSAWHISILTNSVTWLANHANSFVFWRPRTNLVGFRTIGVVYVGTKPPDEICGGCVWFSFLLLLPNRKKLRSIVLCHISNAKPWNDTFFVMYGTWLLNMWAGYVRSSILSSLMHFNKLNLLHIGTTAGGHNCETLLHHRIPWSVG